MVNTKNTHTHTQACYDFLIHKKFVIEENSKDRISSEKTNFLSYTQSQDLV